MRCGTRRGLDGNHFTLAYATQAEVKFELNSENLFPKEKGGKEQQRYCDYRQ